MEGVLGGAIEVEDLLLDTGNAVEDRGRKGLIGFNSGLQVVKGVDLRQEEHLSVGSPKHDNLFCSLFHILDVLLEGIDQFTVSAGQNIVHSVGLIGSDVVRVENSWQGVDLLHLFLELLKKSGLEDSGAHGRLIKVLSFDIPSGDLKVHRVSHRNQLLDWLVNIFHVASFLVKFKTDMGGGTLGEGAKEVGLLLSIASGPGKLATISENASSEGSAVVTSKTDEHNAESGNLPRSFDILGLQDTSLRSLIFRENGESVLIGDFDITLGVVALNSRHGSGWHLLKCERALWYGGDNFLGHGK